MSRIVECIPNLSDGQRKEVIDAIAAAIRSVPGIRLLGSDPDPDHNRTVVTFVGEPEPVEEAAFRAYAEAQKHINLDHQNKQYSLNIDPRTVAWKRVMDMNDRSLRQIIIGMGGKANGIMREDGFNITPASEVMAILCLSNDIADLKRKLGNIYIGQTYDGKPVFARDLKAVGAMAVLLKDAIKSNLVQSLDGNAAILHGGPFASIAQGTKRLLLPEWV